MVCSFLGKTTSTTLCIPYLSIVLCLGLRPLELSPVHVSMSTAVIPVQVMFRYSCWKDIMGLASLTFLGQSLIADFLFLWLLKYVFSLFHNNF